MKFIRIFQILLFTSLATLLVSCSSNTKRDIALLEDDWSTWCEMNYKDAYHGSDLAMNNIGTCFADGIGGFPKDDALALEWFKLAARLGNETARKNILNQGIEPPQSDLLSKRSAGALDSIPFPAERDKKVS